MKKNLFLAALLAAPILTQAASLKVEVWEGRSASSLALTRSFEMAMPEAGETIQASPERGLSLSVSAPAEASKAQRYAFELTLATVINLGQIKGGGASLIIPKIHKSHIDGEADFSLSDRFETTSTPENTSVLNFSASEATDKAVPSHVRLVLTRAP